MRIGAADASRLGVKDADKLTLSANGASVTLPVQIRADIPAGLVITSVHFPVSGVSSLQNKAAASLTVTVSKG